MGENCLVIEGNIDERLGDKERRGSTRKQLLGDLKEKRRYWKYYMIYDTI